MEFLISKVKQDMGRNLEVAWEVLVDKLMNILQNLKNVIIEFL